MQPNINIKEVQRKVYMSYFQDGFWDILLGLFLLAWGIGILTDSAALTGGWFIVAYSAMWALKRRITYPRIGMARIPQERKLSAKLAIAGVVVLFMGIIAFLLVSLGSTPQWLSSYFMFIFGVILAIIVSSIAYWWKINRWYAYAALALVGVAFHQWLDAPLYLCFVVPGTIVILSGLVLLTCFLRKYPKPAGEEHYVNQ